MSTEQRDKAALDISEKRLVAAQEYAITQGLTLTRAIATGLRWGASDGWDAHAVTMPEREAVAETVKHVIETGMNYDDNDWGLIADAVLALLNKED